MKIRSINPANKKLLKEYNLLNLNEALREIEKSRNAFFKWKNLSLAKRTSLIKKVARVLRHNKKQLAIKITNEMGKTINSSILEIEKCAALCDYYSVNAKKFLADETVKTENKKSYVTFEPLGVVFGIMPWNYPFWQVFRFAVAALCAGNVVVVKHASNVLGSALEIEKVFRKTGFPESVLKALPIDSKTATKLINKKSIDAVSVTGSVETGKKIAEIAGRNLKKIVLELGGNDPFIVLKDADLKFTCETGVKARMNNTGQSCIAAKRFIVIKEISEKFEKTFIEYVKKLKVGNPLDKKNNIGPLAREDLVLNIERQVKDAVRKGAKILYGGRRPQELKGYYYMPTILSNVKKGMAVYDEETFGPIASIIVVKNEEEAIKIANSTKFGLGASIWTKNTKKAESLAKKIEAGSVFINGLVKSDPRLPFGGIKNSGYGRELSEYGIKEFVNIKTIVINSQKARDAIKKIRLKRKVRLTNPQLKALEKFKEGVRI